MAKDQYPIVETGSYVEFRFIQKSESGKTSVWAIFNKAEPVPLGIVSWFSRWRKYAFTTQMGMVYEWVCLREIADFVERMTKEHKDKKEEPDA